MASHMMQCFVRQSIISLNWPSVLNESRHRAFVEMSKTLMRILDTQQKTDMSYRSRPSDLFAVMTELLKAHVSSQRTSAVKMNRRCGQSQVGNAVKFVWTISANIIWLYGCSSYDPTVKRDSKV